jgi:hypothetical protein
MDNVTKEYLRRQIQLLRAAEGDAIAFSAILDKLLARVLRTVELQYSSEMSAQAAQFLLSEVVGTLKGFYADEFPKEIAAIGEVVAASEIVWNATTIKKLIGDEAAKVLEPTTKKIIALANKREIGGKTFPQWISRSFAGYTRKVKKIIDNGILEGESIAETVSKVRTLNAGSVSSVKTITRSYFMNVAAEAKTNVFNLNPEIIQGRIWNSTLDVRTTWDICGIRDQMEYDIEYKPVGHFLPWGLGCGRIHFNCRSVEIPKIKGVNSFYERAAIGAGDEYASGDNLTRNGTIRKPTKKNIESGIFNIKQVTTATRYEGFLKAEAKHNIDFVADVLKSKEDAINFRDGKVTLLELAKTNPSFNPTNRQTLR